MLMRFALCVAVQEVRRDRKSGPRQLRQGLWEASCHRWRYRSEQGESLRLVIYCGELTWFCATVNGIAFWLCFYFPVVSAILLLSPPSFFSYFFFFFSNLCDLLYVGVIYNYLCANRSCWELSAWCQVRVKVFCWLIC